MSNIKLPQGHKRNPENHLSWLGEIPALFSLGVTHAWNMRWKWQENLVWDPVRSWLGGRSSGDGGAPLVMHQRLHPQNEHQRNLKEESPLPPGQLGVTLPEVTVDGGQKSFFPSLLSSLAPKWLVCQKAKHLQLEWIRLIKETLPSKRWEVHHLLGSDSSENGCLDFPGSVYDSCQAMLGLSNHPAGDHIIELILSINIDNNKGD